MLRFNLNAISLILLFITGTQPLTAQKDLVHYSQAFKTSKSYRIYLPADYQNIPGKRYPVVYYFHGNTGNHQFGFPGVSELVDKASVILVCWNGRSVSKDERPYNIGYHSNINYSIQFKDYFLELMDHIDKTFRTLKDRSNRALIGHSMGGFMSYFLAGKYPQLIGTVVNSKGSPEFFIGKPSNHTLYQHRYMYKNFNGVKLRFQNGTTGEELVHLNNEVHKGALRQKELDYNYQVYDAIHKLTFPQFRDAFDFVVASFLHPLPVPKRWHHADCYPQFDVWGYQVTSNLDEPGFIELYGVTKGGLTTRTSKWQPDGITIPGVHLKIKTAPLYTPNTSYTLFDFTKTTGSGKKQVVTSDPKGRISFTADHQPHIFGIYEKNGPAELVFAGYKQKDKGIFLEHQKAQTLQIRLLNRGGSNATGLKVTLSSSIEGVTIGNPTIKTENIESGEAKWTSQEFQVTAANTPPGDGTTPYIRFYLTISDDKGNTWNDEFEALVMYEVPEFTEIGIDDGDSEIYGSGNGNNIAEPGETVMIYQESHRTKLYYDDPYIETERLHDDLQPDKWGDGYALSSLIKISKDCPPGHVIRFLASYEVKEWKTIKRNVTWGAFSITIGKKNP